jgi:hypothetical protein
MTPLLSLALLAGIASAETTTLSGLASKLNRLNGTTRETVLLGAAGADAEKALQRMVRDNPVLKVEIVRVPTMGDTAGEMERALALSELSCGLRVVSLGDTYLVDSFGDCRSPQERAAAPEMSSSTVSALAALSQEVDDDPSAAVATSVFAPQHASSSGHDDAQPAAPAAVPPGLDRGDLRAVARSYAKGPEPVVAILESSLVGFGAGHFYSGNPDEGRVHLAVQGGSLGLYLVGMLVMSNASRGSGLDAGAAMSNIGLLGLSAGRLVDIYRAPISAHDARMKNLGGR